MIWASLILLAALAVAMLLPCGRAQLTDSEKRDTLNFVNFLRRNVVPKAGDMNGLLWDDKLAVLAQDAANTCVFQHNYEGAYAGLGENVYKGGKRNMSEILMFMFLERENYDFKTAACNLNSASKYPMFTTCGHYLQLATANLLNIGCGIKQCPDGTNLAFCEFNSGYASPPYQAGVPGTLCHYLLASYSQNGLCYAMRPLDPPPVNGTLDCKITCMNYGTQVYNQYQCGCTCKPGFFGMRCDQAPATRTVPNDCQAQLVACKNGGTPTMTGSVCKCVCPANYQGDACEENILQVSNSVFWYFGQDVMYSSYYPADPSIWTSKLIQSSLMYYLTSELNSYCKANYKSCCPNSASATTDGNMVAYGDFQMTDNYPQNALDGSLKIGIYYRMSDALAQQCGGPSVPYVNRNALLAAAAKAAVSEQAFLTTVGVKAKYE